MTKTRFIISLISVLLFLIGACEAATSIWLYVDWISLVFAVVLPYLVASFIYTPTEQVQMLSECFKSEADSDDRFLTKAVKFFTTLRNIVIASTVATVLMGTIAVMANLEDTSVIGPNLAVALLCPFYSMIYILVVIEPMRATAQKKLTK